MGRSSASGRTARASPLTRSGAQTAGPRAAAYPVVPLPPSSPSAAATGPVTVSVEWTDTNGGGVAYRVERSLDQEDWDAAGTTAAGATQLGDSGLSASTTYYYRVIAAGAVDSAPSATAQATTEGVPDAPSGLTAVAQSSSLISLAWTDHSANETGFEIERSPDGSGSWTLIHTTAAGVTSYDSSGLSASTEYFYRVRAVNAGGDSAYSNTGSDTTLASDPPEQPVSLEATALSDTEIALTWDLADELDTAVLIDKHNGSTYQTIATLAGGRRTWTDTSCVPGTSYQYGVRASNVSGSSARTTATVGTLADGSDAGNAVSGFGVAASSAWQITVSWTNPSSFVGTAPNVIVERSADGGLRFSIVKVLSAGSASAARSWADTPLSPGTTYHYRVRLTTGSAYGPYSSPASATTSVIGGSPGVPTGLAVVENSATSAAISWTDVNSGAATYKVETAPIPGGGTPDTAVWTQQTETAAGASSYALTTTARTPVYVRVRANLSGSHSAYTAPVVCRPPSSGSGGTTYNVGSGQTYASIAAFEAAVGDRGLAPGDTVRIHAGTYAEKWLLSCRGTAAAPITIQGVKDGSGNRPVISGLSATTPSTSTPANGSIFQDFSVLLLWKRSADPSGHVPGHLVIESLQIQDGYQLQSPNTYTRADASTGTYLAGVSSIYLAAATDVVIRDCVLTNSSNGVFAADDSTDLRPVEDLTIDGCHIHGNGTASGFSQHNLYVEAIRVTYQYNRIGPIRATSGGAEIKDRGPGTVIRYNWIEGRLRPLDIVECQNSALKVLPDPTYNETHVYGNLIVNNGEASNPIHYGGDSTGDWYYRKGRLLFYHNTFVNYFDASSGGNVFRVALFYSDGAECLEAVNNVIYAEKATGGGTRPEVNLFSQPSGTDLLRVGVFGVNYVTTGYLTVRSSNNFIGVAQGVSAFVSPSDNLPGLTNVASGDYTLASGSVCLDVSGRLPDDFYPVNRQYVVHQSGQDRAVNGAAADLGAYER